MNWGRAYRSPYISYLSDDPAKHLPSLPGYLYKYVKKEDLLEKILPGKSLRFSQPGVFNDPFEVLPNIRQFINWKRLVENLRAEQYEEQLDQFVESLKLNPFWSQVTEDKLREIGRRLMPVFQPLAGLIAETADELMSRTMRERMPAELQNGVGVLCLTEEPHNLLMWAHYANMHHEFVLEFDARHPYFDIRKNDPDELRQLRKVRYSKERPAIGLLNFRYDDLFYTKSAEWSYENEWRMVVANSDVDKIIGEGESRVMLRKFPPEVLTSIIVGYRTPAESIQELLQLLESDDDLRHVRVKQADMHDNEFGVTFRPVPFHDVAALKSVLDELIPEYRGEDEDYAQLIQDLARFRYDRIRHVRELIDSMKDRAVNVLNFIADFAKGRESEFVDEIVSQWGREGCPVNQTGFVRTLLNLKFGIVWGEYAENELEDEDTDNPFASLDFQPYAQAILGNLPEVVKPYLTPEQFQELMDSIPSEPELSLPSPASIRRLTDREIERLDLDDCLTLTVMIAEMFGNRQAGIDHLAIAIAHVAGAAQDVLKSKVEIPELVEAMYVCRARKARPQISLLPVEMHPLVMGYLIEAIRIGDLNGQERIDTSHLLLALMKDINDASLVLSQFGCIREQLAAELNLKI